MKEIEATRLKLAAMELVEGTELKWRSVIRDNNGQYRKPKTAMVELPIGDIEYWGSIGQRTQSSLDDASLRLSNACRKTLNQLATNAPRDGNKYLETSYDDGKTAGFTREKLK